VISSSQQVNVLDLKKSQSSQSAKEAANKKNAKAKGFGDELVEKQKKLKKKDDDVGPVQQSKSDRHDTKKLSKEETSQQSPGKDGKKSRCGRSRQRRKSQGRARDCRHRNRRSQT